MPSCGLHEGEPVVGGLYREWSARVDALDTELGQRGEVLQCLRRRNAAVLQRVVCHDDHVTKAELLEADGAQIILRVISFAVAKERTTQVILNDGEQGARRQDVQKRRVLGVGVRKVDVVGFSHLDPVVTHRIRQMYCSSLNLDRHWV